jgi:hypothetical protein
VPLTELAEKGSLSGTSTPGIGVDRGNVFMGKEDRGRES